MHDAVAELAAALELARNFSQKFVAAINRERPRGGHDDVELGIGEANRQHEGAPLRGLHSRAIKFAVSLLLVELLEPLAEPAEGLFFCAPPLPLSEQFARNIDRLVMRSLGFLTRRKAALTCAEAKIRLLRLLKFLPPLPLEQRLLFDAEDITGGP
jgi:hypothetical protein